MFANLQGDYDLSPAKLYPQHIRDWRTGLIKVTVRQYGMGDTLLGKQLQEEITRLIDQRLRQKLATVRLTIK